MTLSKKRVVVLIVFVALAAMICVRVDRGRLKKFRRYRSQEGRFSILFPGKPKRKVKSSSAPNGEVEAVWYRAGSRKVQFAVRYVDYPQAAENESSEQKLVNEHKDHLMQEYKGRLLNERAVHFHGRAAIQFKFRRVRKRKEFVARARLILIENRLYLLMVESRLDDLVKKYADKFFNSFNVDSVG